jgi:hypothetical protein
MNAPRKARLPIPTRGSCRERDSNFREARQLTSLRVKNGRHKRHLEAVEKDWALHDLPETKGVNVYGQNVSTLYLIQKLRVRLLGGIRVEKSDATFHDVSEKEEVSVYGQNVETLHLIQTQRINLMSESRGWKKRRGFPRC